MMGQATARSAGIAAGRWEDNLPTELLAEGLSRFLGRPACIDGVEGRPLEDCSTHPIHRLRVCLSTGEELPVVFKQLKALPNRPQAGREVLIYRRFLSGGRFSAPYLYASVHDESQGRFWLLLEDVGRQPLESRPREDWLAAVLCLARLHAAYLGRADELRALEWLGELGPEHYHWLAGTARHNLESAADEAALTQFDRLMQGYERLVGCLMCQPQTLIHGDIFPWNLLLQPGPRVRLIDWESTTLGPPAWDLARLLDGWGREKSAFLTEYFNEVERHSNAALDKSAFTAAFRMSAVPVVLLHLAWSAEDLRDQAYRAELLRVLETAWAHARKEGADG